MDPNNGAQSGSPTRNRDKMGPGFDTIFGPLMRNRRLLRYHWNEYRTGGANNRKSGVAGNFGFTYQFLRPSDDDDFLSATLSDCKSIAAKRIGEEGVPPANARPYEEIPQGTIWNYELRGYIFKRNGTSFPARPVLGSAEPGDDPNIMQETYTYGVSATQLGIKYAQITFGLDWIRNYQSNSGLYG